MSYLPPVPEYGPPDAPLLIVGEAGGPAEGKSGRPFDPSGATGRKVRGFVKAAGLDPDTDVRYANVIPFAMGSLPKQQSGVLALVHQHWSYLDDVFLHGTPKVILAVGRAALYRIMGLTRITEHACNVWPGPGEGVLYKGEYVGINAPGVPVVASVHPAAVMRSKLEAGWTLVARAIEKAAGLTKRPYDYTTMEPEHVMMTAYDEVMDFLRDASFIWCDTEFDVRTGKPFLVGCATERSSVVAEIRVNPETIAALQESMRSPAVKVFHHAPADLSSLLTIGIDCAPPFLCNLRLHALVWPDLPVGLAKVAPHLLEDVHNWKGMAHDDPAYNALDVVLTKGCTYALEDEVSDAELWDVWNTEAQHVMVLFAAMEARGLAVGRAEQKALVEAATTRVAELEEQIAAVAGDIYARRSVPVQAQLDGALAAIKEATAYQLVDACEEHPKYLGLVKPRGKSKGKCTCATIYAMTASVRATVKLCRKIRDDCKTKLERWSAGFVPSNNDHVRWLLYDKEALALPVQKKDGSITANADAVARIQSLKKVRTRPDFETVVEPLLAAIKDLQHEKKMLSTFALWDTKKNAPRGLDKYGVAHPEYRDYGAGTGRPAGGSDDDLADKRGSAYSYNALNIPKDWRVLYVPHDAGYVPDPAILVRDVVDDFDYDEEVDEDEA